MTTRSKTHMPTDFICALDCADENPFLRTDSPPR